MTLRITKQYITIKLMHSNAQLLKHIQTTKCTQY